VAEETTKDITMSAVRASTQLFGGYAPAIPTPFDGNGKVDIAALERYCDWQIKSGASALIACGTTGEAPTLTDDEHRTIVRTVVDVSDGRVPVIAGTGSNSTVHAVALEKDAAAAGADAVLSVVPYYNRPTPRGVQAHFMAIMEAASLPVILYDVPARTGCALTDDTIVRLAQHRRCAGLKDATGDPTRALRLRSKLGAGFGLWSGDDSTVLAFLAHGGDGCISVTSNVAPGLCKDMYEAWERGDKREFQRLTAIILDLTRVLFREASPAPVKYALSLRGLMGARVRLPLCEVTDPTKFEIRSVLAELFGPNIKVEDESAPPANRRRVVNAR
jgi:4-hydroxy-tetrahydrodipicolinate synthase